MSLPTTRYQHKVEKCRGIKIITFAASKDQDSEDMIGQALAVQTDAVEVCHLLLDFTNVECISSVELGSRVGGQRVVRQDGHFSNRPSPNRTCNFQSIRLSSEPFFRCSEVHRLSALRIPLYLPSGSPVALRHVVGFPVLGLLRRLRSHEALAF